MVRFSAAYCTSNKRRLTFSFRDKCHSKTEHTNRGLHSHVVVKENMHNEVMGLSTQVLRQCASHVYSRCSKQMHLEADCSAWRGIFLHTPQHAGIDSCKSIVNSGCSWKNRVQVFHLLIAWLWWGETDVSEPRPSLPYCSSPRWLWVESRGDENAGWVYLLTCLPKLTVSPTSTDIWSG
jgi:hypothetical protein